MNVTGSAYGGGMRKRILTAITAALAGALLLGAGVAAASADVDDFAIESFDAVYELSRDEAGRSSLETVEHIVAVFPDFDQNRGLIRDLTRVYDGHDTELQVLSVTDETGAPREYETEPYGDFLSVVMAVPEGEYVHGAQHYVITYTQRDVTRHFEDTGSDEFYWDVNGTGWTQPFGRVSARFVLSDELIAAFNGNAACYYGAFGEDQHCEITTDETSIMTEVLNLVNGENVTVAMGFEPGTFATAPEPPTPFLQRVPLLLWSGYASLAAAAIAFFTALFVDRGARTGRAIIAQYEPPAGISVAVAAQLLKAGKKAMTATLLDFAVRRKLKLLHHVKTDQYGAQAIDDTGLLPIEHRAYARIFGGSAVPGGVALHTTQWFSKTSTRLGDASLTLRSDASTELTKLGLVKKANGKAIGSVVIFSLLALALPIIHSIITGNFVAMTILLAVGINVLIWTLFGAIAALATRRRLTNEGALLLDHLKGLREYIRLAEADRIRMLQSASGAEVDEHYIVQIYERLLPYAVLFGFENEWQGELARYYRESSPDWVVGAGEGAASSSFMRTLPISSFANTVASSPRTVTSSSGGGSGSSFSSFSGGSSGGGFSGGGGGGGGGRGI